MCQDLHICSSFVYHLEKRSQTCFLSEKNNRWPSRFGTYPVKSNRALNLPARPNSFSETSHVHAAITPYCKTKFSQKLRRSWCLASGTTVSVLPEDPLLQSAVAIAFNSNVPHCCAEHANEENYDQVYNQDHEGSMTHEALGGELQAPSLVR